ncbi:MAG: phosphoribosylformylglycinamidine synthase subunit PurQ, partial [Myxococcales bacterium]|nr:phosphoribosylformylglycinamidine synthase subunit PurQ [Myxococcales bacterium]
QVDNQLAVAALATGECLDGCTYEGGFALHLAAAGRPVLGICNGFQALVKAGLIPGADEAGVWSKRRPATLTHNASGQFECRWVTLAPVRNSRSLFTRGLTELIDCPVAHGEGRVVPRDADALAGLEAAGQVALRYVQADGGPAAWPANPNGSANDIAALCNPAGNVMGLMPHPEDHLRAAQHPQRLGGRLGLALFTAGVRHARQD